MTTNVVLDTSVLFSACHSISGSARDLVDAALDGRANLVVSTYILAEVRRNLLRKSDHGLATLHIVLVSDALVVVDPNDEAMRAVGLVVARKDAPVIAVAIVAKAPIVATYDQRHLLSRAEEILAAFGVEVLTPREVLDRLAAK